jgi:hypothetical protein
VRVFGDVDVLGKHLLAQRIEQERALAVQRAATDGLHKAAQQAGGQGRLKQHGALGGGDLARLQAAQGALGGIAADRLGAGQLICAAHGAVPGVALHAVALARNGCHRNAVARAGIAAAKAARVGAEKMALLGRHTAPSLLVMRLSVFRAASSHSRASVAASSLVTAQG